VLNIGKLRRGGENYYLNSVARGVEDYYLGSGEAPGYWLATGTADLGLEGQVGDEQLRQVLKGAAPGSGKQLVKPRRGERVPGFDLTFLAPKSVALLHELGPKEASNEVVNAHDAAVAAALAYLERHASGARRGRAGRISIASKGFIAAAFRHRTSRAGDPLLHTHVLVANLIQGDDGKWGALDAKHLYRHAKTAGYLYQSHLRHELTRRLGVEWTAIRKGSADIEGISRDAIVAFSKRRVEVEALLEERTGASRREREVAALTTRQAKDYSVSPQRLLPEWRERAAGVGLTDDVFEACLGKVTERGIDEALVREIGRELIAPTGLTAQESSFSRREALQGFAARLGAGAPVSEIEAITDTFLASEQVLPLSERALGDTASASAAVAAGRSAPSSVEPRYTTAEMVKVEREVVESAIERRFDHAGVADTSSLQAALEARPSLFDDQRAMVQSLTSSGLGVEVVVGKAGAGKTFALDAARDAWERSGHHVVGCTLAARAARELESGSGIRSFTIAGVLKDLDDPASGGLPANSVLVVDEAGMVGTRDLKRLLDHAQQAGVKAVLVGDDRQLPEISAGGAFRGIKNRLPATELSEVRRQPFGWERDTLDLIREGRAKEAVDAYLEHDRVVLTTSSEETRRRLIADWWLTQDDSEPAVMIAAHRSDVADLNSRARTMMSVSGKLGDEEIEFQGSRFAVGDRVMTLQNSTRLGVNNGDRGTVVGLDADRRTVSVQRDDGISIRLPRSYLEAGNLTHAYAMTGHKTQAMTTNKAFVLGDETLYREWTYVAMSRGRNDNRLYVVAGVDPEREEVGGEVASIDDPLREVVDAVGRSRAKDLAIDVYEQESIRGVPTPELRREWEELSIQLSSVPPNVERQRNHNERELAEMKQALEAERSIIQDAQAQLRSMGPWGRVREGSRKRELSHRIENATKAQRRLVRDTESLEQRARELETETRLRDRWIADNAPQIRRRFAVERELWWREQHAALRAEVMMPSYLRDHVGPRPERPSERGAWHAAVRAVESYRERWGVTDPDHAFGRGEMEPLQKEEREAVEVALTKPAPADTQERDADVVLERSREL